jgi:hypothetical protein
MSGAIPPLPQYAFMAWCSAKAQRQLYVVVVVVVVVGCVIAGSQLGAWGMFIALSYFCCCSS